MPDVLQIIKTREDHVPVTFVSSVDAADGNKPFLLAEDSECSWVKKDESFGTEKLRGRIEPWLTALVQSEHLSVLVGSGLPYAVHYLATGRAGAGMDAVRFSVHNDRIRDAAQATARKAGRQEGNLEDQIRVANELLRGLEIIQSTESAQLKANLQSVLSSLAASVLNAENGLITSAPDDREKAFSYLISFLMSFASRSGTRERLHLFTTNYDRYIEAGADVAGLRLIDRFVGSLAPIFRASRLDVDMHYNPPGIRGEPRYLEGVARYTKLHGSIDWVYGDDAIRRVAVPFGAKDINPYLNAQTPATADMMQLMVYPNSAKDRETAAYPYVELFRDFASNICRPNSTLVCYGYSFGDEHINRVIEDMLTVPSAHLVVISYSDPLGRIMRVYERIGRPAQVTLLVGSHLGDLKTLVDQYLPKPAIDRTTFRMADLLRSRWGTADNGDGMPHGNANRDA